MLSDIVDALLANGRDVWGLLEGVQPIKEILLHEVEYDTKRYDTVQGKTVITMPDIQAHDDLGLQGVGPT